MRSWAAVAGVAVLAVVLGLITGNIWFSVIVFGLVVVEAGFLEVVRQGISRSTRTNQPGTDIPPINRLTIGLALVATLGAVAALLAWPRYWLASVAALLVVLFIVQAWRVRDRRG